MDGWLRIGTKLETKEFDKQIESVKYELEQIEFELENKKELNLDTTTIRDYEKKAEKLKNKLIDLNKAQQNLEKANLNDVQKSIGH